MAFSSYVCNNRSASALLQDYLFFLSSLLVFSLFSLSFSLSVSVSLCLWQGADGVRGLKGHKGEKVWVLCVVCVCVSVCVCVCVCYEMQRDDLTLLNTETKSQY